MMLRNTYKYPTIARIKQQYKLNTASAQRKSYNKSTVNDTLTTTCQRKLIDTLNDYIHKYVMNSDQTRIQQSIPPVCTIHQACSPAVVTIDINTNSNVNATCTVRADGGIMYHHFIHSLQMVVYYHYIL